MPTLGLGQPLVKLFHNVILLDIPTSLHSLFSFMSWHTQVACTFEKVLEWPRSLALIGKVMTSHLTLQNICCNAALGACQRLDHALACAVVFLGCL